ncbi:MAG: CDP-diacylglycerol--serine O-phosphatidyltransferase [Deltaproteobacteria bacterium]|nr:CDP-diacylglycerol--serine O-phosphatidyltransferase [Deltaproteobacteria bacterium]
MTKPSRFRKADMKKGVYLLPNLFTTASLFCGFYSIIASVKGNFFIAAIAIIIAIALDGLDGRIARITNTISKFGAEYDSLSDLVSFGVAPTVLMYMWSLFQHGKWGWLTAFLFVVCGAMRLARFNVQSDLIDSRVFNGLPIPAAAAAVATAVLLYHYLGGEGTFSNPVVIFSVIGLSLLMVSSVKYYSFKDLNFFARQPFMSFFLIVLIFIIVVAEPQIMMFTFAFGYGLSGPVWQLARAGKKYYEDTRQRRTINVKKI